VSAGRVNRAIGLAVLALAVVLALAPLVFERPAVPEHGSADSPEDGGRRGLFLLFEELGFHPQRWNQPPGRLPHGRHALWLAGVPDPWIEQGTGERARHFGARRDDAASSDRLPKPDATPPALAVRALSQYRSFLDQGGTIVMAYSDRAQRFLRDELHVDACAELALDANAPAGERVVHTSAGEDLAVDWPAGATFGDAIAGAVVLWSRERAGPDQPEEPDVLALELPVGDGRLVLLGTDSFLDNAHLRERDHALLAVRLEEAERAAGGALLFDESALGARANTSATELALSPRFFLATAHLVLLALLFVWTRAWVGAFPRDPQPLARVSPISRARARAALYERARRFDLLAAMLRRGAVRRWRATAHVRAPLDGDGEERFAAGDLRSIAEKLGAPRDVALAARPVLGAADLEKLACDLDLVTAEIAARARRPMPSRR
jgi:hypothetical protein